MDKKLFYWSMADESPSVCDLSRRQLWRIGIWVMIWVMLFGFGVYID